MQTDNSVDQIRFFDSWKFHYPKIRNSHGCSADAAADISEDGFDPRLANDAAMFGKAVYFAENPAKSDQYTGKIRTTR